MNRAQNIRGLLKGIDSSFLVETTEFPSVKKCRAFLKKTRSFSTIKRTHFIPSTVDKESTPVVHFSIRISGFYLYSGIFLKDHFKIRTTTEFKKIIAAGAKIAWKSEPNIEKPGGIPWVKALNFSLWLEFTAQEKISDEVLYQIANVLSDKTIKLSQSGFGWLTDPGTDHSLQQENILAKIVLGGKKILRR